MSVCAVIISYYPNKEIISNISALIEQVDEIFVVDNGSGTVTQNLLEPLSRHPKINLIFNAQNVGIAAALNIGIRHARMVGHEWVCTFDQDSRVTPSMIGSMLAVYDTYPDKNSVSGLSPRYRDTTNGSTWGSRLKYPRDKALPYAEPLVVMTSGNLVKLAVFDVVGCFNEALFIDQVDHEFCLRCATHGYKILEVYDAILEHGLGVPTQHKFLGKTIVTSNHSTLRRYYIARNGVYVYKKFIFKYPVWVLKDAYAIFKEIFTLLVFESNRRQKMAAVSKGIIHGIFGRMGKFECSNLAGENKT